MPVAMGVYSHTSLDEATNIQPWWFHITKLIVYHYKYVFLFLFICLEKTFFHSWVIGPGSSYKYRDLRLEQ